MNSNLDKIALDLYGKIETRFPNIKIGDENATVLSKKQDIPKARFFEFEYKDEGVSLGNVAITLDEDDGIVVQLIGDLASNRNHRAFKFIKSFRQFAKDRLLNFDVQNIAKSELDKRDYEFQSKRKEEPMEPMMESKMYGTSKISYQDLGEAKLIVKHSQPVNTDLAAGRTMHIENIYIENAIGERFRYPVKHLNGARALAEHIKAGGHPYDGIGQHITSLSEELAQLRKFKGYVGRNETLSEAMDDINQSVSERIDAVKKEVHSLQRPAYYQQFAESFQAQENQEIPEDILNDWINRLTVRTFNEELKTAFPYIYRLVGENIAVRELSPDDVLSELRSEEKDKEGNVVRWKEEGEWKKDTGKDGRGKVTNMSDKARRETEKLNKKDESLDPEGRFESFIDSIVREDEDSQQGENELFSSDFDKQSAALTKLKDLLAGGLTPGVDGVNAALSLKGIIDSETFANDYLNGMSDEDDVGTMVKKYLNDLATGKIEDASLESSTTGDVEEIAQTIVAGKQLDSGTDDTPIGGETPAPDAAAPTPGAEPVAPPPEAAPPVAPDPGAVPPVAPPEAAPPAPVAESAHPKAKLIKAIHTAKKHGAKLDTKLDFGNKEMTLHDCIEECGMSPKDFGFGDDEEGSNESGVQQILKSIAGFWNKEAKNFTIGGTRAKINVMKSFKNGEFKNASEDDLRRVIQLIDKADPSGNTSKELGHIKHLAGVHNQMTDEQMPGMNMDPSAMMQQQMQAMQARNPKMANLDPATMMKNQQAKMAQMKQQMKGQNGITVNGKPATQAEFDAFTKQHNVIPGQMPGGQKLIPGQLPKMTDTDWEESTELHEMLKIAGLRK